MRRFIDNLTEVKMMLNNAILYSATTASLVYLKKREYLFLSIEGFVKTSTLLELINAIEYGIAHNHVKRIIFDTSQVKVIKREDIQLLKTNLLPLLARSGVSKIALINPADIFGGKSIETLSGILNEKISTKIFPNMEKSEFWLFSN